MPTYVYTCEKCERTWEEVRPMGERNTCTCTCGRKAERDEMREFASKRTTIFTPHTYTDLGVDPIHVTSKRQLVDLCKRRNLQAARLDGVKLDG